MNTTTTTLVTPPPPSSAKSQTRLVSLDQFRGYTVVGMLLVNYLGGYEACPQVLKHSHDYCSYADTIMPQFLFAVGFAFRLTFGRRVQLQGTTAAYFRVVQRMLGLMIVSLVVYNVGRRAEYWEELVDLGIWGAIRDPLKRDWFQTLMHIAMTGLWLVPVIRASALVRILWIAGSAIAHVLLSYWFLYLWNNGSADAFDGTIFERFNWYVGGNVIDGGPFGFLTWVVPAGIGTLACDAIADAAGRPKLGRLFVWSIVIMAAGWLMSCGTRMYDVPIGEDGKLQPELAPSEKVESNPSSDVSGKDPAPKKAKSRNAALSRNPVVPPKEAFDRWTSAIAAGRWNEALAEPPFVPPPHTADFEMVEYKVRKKVKVKEIVDGREVEVEKIEEQKRDKERTVDRSADYRKWNYWMMSQRGGTLSYPLFSAGFSLLVYVFFYVACDIYRLQLAFFRTFGTNALLAYIVPDLTGKAVQPFMPKDMPFLPMVIGLCVFFWLTWLFVRAAEKQGAYIRV